MARTRAVTQTDTDAPAPTPCDRASFEQIYSDPTAAFDAATRDLASATQRGDAVSAAWAHLTLGSALTYLEDHPRAMQHLAAAQVGFASGGDQAGQLTTISRRSAIHIFDGEVELAEQLLSEHLSAVRAQDHPQLLVEYLNNLGALDACVYNLHSAIGWLAEAREVAIAADWTFGRVWTAINLASCHILLRDAPSVRATCEEALEMIEGHHYLAVLRVHLLNSLASAHEISGDLPAAIEHFQLAGAAATHGDVRTASIAQMEEARLRRAIGDAAGALSCYRTMVARLEVLPNTSDNDFLIIARCGIAAITHTWTREIADTAAALLAQHRPVEQEQQVPLHDLLVEGWHTLGDYPAALAQHRAAIALRETLWQQALHVQASASAHAEQARQARERAVAERIRREEADRTLAQVQQLNAQNAALIVRLREQTELLEQLSRTDALTGLSNRRHFDERLQAECVRTAIFGRPLAVALVDVDHFKAINDRWSHAIGDRVLQQIATCMTSTLRGTDLVARYGGEEFAILLTEAPLDAAYSIIERLRQTIEQHAWDSIAPGLRVTISVGLWGTQARCAPDEALAEADARLYRAKRTGRNRVVAT